MRFRPSDAWLLLCLGASFAAMLFAVGGDLVTAAWLFFAAYGVDAIYGLVGPPRRAHRFGAELRDVVALVAFAAAPALIAHVALSRLGLPWLLAAGLGAVPLVTGSVRMALHTVRPRGEGSWAAGLPRPQSALIIVGLCRSSLLAPGPLQVLALALLVFVPALNLAPWPFARPFVLPLTTRKLVLWLLAFGSVAAAAVLGRGPELVVGWSLAAGLLGVLPVAAAVAPPREPRA